MLSNFTTLLESATKKPPLPSNGERIRTAKAFCPTLGVLKVAGVGLATLKSSFSTEAVSLVK